MDVRFVGDEVLLSVIDGQGRDLSSGYTFEIVVVGPDNTEREAITATAGGTGNKTITASSSTDPATFDVVGVYTYHATLTTTGGTPEVHRVGTGYVEIVAVPGT